MALSFSAFLSLSCRLNMRVTHRERLSYLVSKSELVMKGERRHKLS